VCRLNGFRLIAELLAVKAAVGTSVGLRMLSLARFSVYLKGYETGPKK
jgi:hypothetical protein